MVCPMRAGVKFDVVTFNDRPVVISQEEFYPECYEEECPYYTYPNGCNAIEEENT